MNTLPIALVTGSSTGIGSKLAQKLAPSYNVVVTGRNQEALDKVVKLCNERREDSAVSFNCDLSDLSQIDTLIESIKNKFSKLNLLVNNACWRGDIGGDINEALEETEFEDVMKINLLVPMYLVNKCAINLKEENGKLLVINISSVASQIVVPMHSYSVSKACLSELTRQIAKNSSQTSVYAISVSPGVVLTDERPFHADYKHLTLVNRIASPDEIADFIANTIENAELFNGQEMFIDGGYIAKQVVTILH